MRGSTAFTLKQFGGSPFEAKSMATNLKIEVEREGDGRWIAEVAELPGVLAYGQSREEAVSRVQSLSLRVLADRLEHGEDVPDLANLFSVVA